MPPDAARTQVPRAWVAINLLIVYVVFGSTYLAIRVMVQSIPPLLGAGLRFAVAGTVLMLGWTVGHRRRPRLDWRQFGGVTAIGLVVIGGMGLLTVGEETVPSGLAALLLATTPAWVVLIRAAHGERIAQLTWLGVAIGLSGVALLAVSSGVGTSIAIVGFLLVMSSAVGDATGSFYAERLTARVDPLLSAAVQMVVVGPILVVAGILRGEDVDPGSWQPSGMMALLYLIGPGSIVAYSSFVWLVTHTPPSIATTYTYVNPVVAVLLGWMILDERLTALDLIAAAIVVTSVAAITRGERQ
jgi:drug/metabolite transporter (DMT)-like permease